MQRRYEVVFAYSIFVETVFLVRNNKDYMNFVVPNVGIAVRLRLLLLLYRPSFSFRKSDRKHGELSYGTLN